MKKKKKLCPISIAFFFWIEAIVVTVNLIFKILISKKSLVHLFYNLAFVAIAIVKLSYRAIGIFFYHFFLLFQKFGNTIGQKEDIIEGEQKLSGLTF